MDLYEKIHKKTGMGYSIIWKKDCIEFYKVIQWHPILVKKIELKDKNIVIEERII